MTCKKCKNLIGICLMTELANKGIIIFSRYDSSRLPGKALIDIEGRSLLQRVIDRVKLVGEGIKIIVATSDRGVEEPIIECATAEGVSVFRGEFDNVAKRAYDCARHYNLTHFARVCGDRAFVPHQLITEFFEWSEKENLDLATNAIDKTYPPGFTTEIVKTDAMETLLASTSLSDDLEHVTKYIYSNMNMFKVGNKVSDIDYGKISLVVDDENDLDRARYMVRKLGSKPQFAGIEEVVDAAKSWYSKKSL